MCDTEGSKRHTSRLARHDSLFFRVSVLELATAEISIQALYPVQNGRLRFIYSAVLSSRLFRLISGWHHFQSLFPRFYPPVLATPPPPPPPKKEKQEIPTVNIFLATTPSIHLYPNLEAALAFREPRLSIIVILSSDRQQCRLLLLVLLTIGHSADKVDLHTAGTRE